MRVPLNWLKNYIELPKDQVKLTDRLTLAGHMLDKVDNTKAGRVIDLELRGNRADCYSIYGIAREVKALFGGILKEPKVYKKLKVVTQLPEIKNNIKTKYVKRAMMVIIKDVIITESPKWLKEALAAYGMTSINNIVDLTNFVMIETGEPLHAFDLDKLSKNIEIRLAKEGEEMETFQGVKIKLTKDDLIWSMGKKPLSIAGAIGEASHSISSSTKNVLLEAANYDRANIRRTIHRHNLLTEAGIRHEKELDPNLVETGIYRFLELIDKNSWGKIEDKIFDYYPDPQRPVKANLSFNKISSLSGIEIDKKEVKKIFDLLGFKILKEKPDYLTLEVPTFRTDVISEEDLIEEVLRIYGYDKIPVKTLSQEIPHDVTPKFIKQEIDIKNILIGLGFDEIISFPFVKEKSSKLNKSLNNSLDGTVCIINPPSPDIRNLRQNLFVNLYEAVKRLSNEREKEARFFEIGKIYYKKENNYNEVRKLGIVYWKEGKESFVKFKGFLENFLERLAIRYQFKTAQVDYSFDNTFEIFTENATLGLGGVFEGMFYVEFNLDEILFSQGQLVAKTWPKYPPQVEDITLEVETGTFIGDVIDAIKIVSSQVAEVNLKDIYKNSYTFRIKYQDETKTLTDSEVKEIRNKILEHLEKEFEIRLK